MFVRSKKLTLSSPYKKIDEALWQSKRLNTLQEQQNLELRTKMQKIVDRHPKRQQENLGQNKLEEKFVKLSQKYKEQASWIQKTTAEIQQRNYEELCVSVKRLENKMKRRTKKALKMEKKIKTIYVKEAQKADKQVKTFLQTPQETLEILEQQNKDLEDMLEAKLSESQRLEDINRGYNKEIIDLLTIKNVLREKLKQQSSRLNNTNMVSRSRLATTKLHS